MAFLPIGSGQSMAGAHSSTAKECNTRYWIPEHAIDEPYYAARERLVKTWLTTRCFIPPGLLRSMECDIHGLQLDMFAGQKKFARTTGPYPSRVIGDCIRGS